MTNEKYDYRLDVPSVEREDDFVEPKIVVAKTPIDEKQAMQMFEEEKIDLFKTFFKRPKEDEVVIKTITKSFEPYVIAGGEYELRYLSEQTYAIDLLDDAIAVFLLGDEIFVPEEEADEEVEEEETETKKKSFFEGLFSSFRSKKTPEKPQIELSGIEHVHIKKEIMEARNYRGKSINPDALPEAEFQEVDKTFLKKEVSMLPEDYYDLSSLTQEIIDENSDIPDHASRVLLEKLRLTDRKIMLYPVYWAEMVYKESKRKNVRLETNTGVISSPKGTRYAPPPESDSAYEDITEPEPVKKAGANYCPECGATIVSGSQFCQNCGVKLD